MRTITTKLDMRHGAVPQVIHLSQYDSDFVLNFELYSTDGSFTLESGTTAAIRGTKTDGEPFSMDASVYGSTVTVTGTHDEMQQLTAAAGRNIFELTLYKNGKEINTSNFIVLCERAAMDKDTMGGQSVIRELVSVIDRTDEIIDAAHLADQSCQTVTQLEASAQAASQNATQKASEAAQSASTAQTALSSAQAEIESTKQAALDAVDEAYQDNIAEINRKGEQIVAITTNAEQIASQALSTANNAENHMATLDNQMRRVENALKNVSIDPDDLGLEQDPDTYYVYPTYKGVRSENGIPLSSSGGGGGGGGETIKAVLTVENLSGWNAKTIAEGSDVSVQLRWSSIEDEMPTGDGAVRITVNEVVRATYQVAQGQVNIDLKPYISTGTNKVKIRISDSYDQGQTKVFNITSIALSISSTFDTSQPYTSAFSVPVTPVGAVEKTIYAYVDGRKVAEQTTQVSNRQISLAIPAQTHGGHSLRIYFDAEINGEAVRSNILYFEFIYIEPLNDTVIITSSFDTAEVSQYSSIPIPFTVYDPNSLTAEVALYANNELLSRQTVDRTEHSYTYKANKTGTLEFKIISGTTTKTLTTTVVESEVDVDPVTEDLALYLSSYGRSNAEAHPDTWEYNSIQCGFNGFNWKSDGWHSDKDGISVMRVSGDARITVPYKPFESDFRSTGKTIEIEFATRNVLDYDSEILSCMSGNRGISLTAQRALLKSEQSSISTQYKEDEHVRIAFVVEKRAENRLLFIYINGIASGVVQYPTDDDFSQQEPVNITIGSNNCTIDLYCIRIYDNDLTRHQILDNWIADTQDGTQMLERYMHNNVYDAYGNIAMSALPADLPYLIIEAGELPQYKGDKKTITGSYVDRLHPSKGFTYTGAQADVQGTSSQYYPRKNYKIKFKDGFELPAGKSAKYAINTDAIPVNTFTFKADVASSEGANNVELARLYNDACPYKTPAQTANNKVRQGIDGFPCVLFWDNGESTTFLGKYNFNNDKGTEEVFGFASPDESWEIKNNTGNRVLWKSSDYSGEDWLNDFEARYPDTDPPYVNPQQLATFAEWAKSTDTEAATGDTLASPVTYAGVTYTADTAEYRLAKFKAEAGNYMEMESTLFYYLFTELFLMVDSRAKNAFPSFIGSEVDA